MSIHALAYVAGARLCRLVIPVMRATLKTPRRFSLNWSYLEAISQGVSAIDLGAMALRHIDDARQFACEYGYDHDQPAVRAYVQRIHCEAVRFVRETFLAPDQQGHFAPEVAEAPDPLQLLVMASHGGHRHEPARLWACAVLKVMHGLFYIDNNLKLRHFETIRQQVFNALDTVLRVDDEGRSWLCDGQVCLPIVHLERKRNKSRHSILLKLLQKPEYVAADIHDHLGLRLALPTRMECLLALDLLRRSHVISVTNLEVSRTRNTLLDLTLSKQVFNRWRVLIDRCEGYPRELFARMDAELAMLENSSPQAPLSAPANNPHSAVGFRSLQLTVRKMIHLPGSALAGRHLTEALDSAMASGLPDVSFFFAFEIQLLDAASLALSLQGEASHEAYKRRQVHTARRRVLGPTLVGLLRGMGGGAPDAQPEA
jgi:uncharacterized protein (TIGR04562 family)